MMQSHRDLMESNATLTRTMRRLSRQVSELTGVVARLAGYQMDDVNDHPSDREQERRQKRMHEEPPATAEAPAMPPFLESGIPAPFTFVDFDDLFFRSMVPPDIYQQSIHFMDLLYEQPHILEQEIEDPKVERSMPD